MTETNLPSFATILAGLPKRLRNGLQVEQHGRSNTMLITHADDDQTYVGRLIKKGNGRYTFEAFDAPYPAEETDGAKIITEGRTSTPLRGISLARQFCASHKAA